MKAHKKKTPILEYVLIGAGIITTGYAGYKIGKKINKEYIKAGEEGIEGELEKIERAFNKTGEAIIESLEDIYDFSKNKIDYLKKGSLEYINEKGNERIIIRHPDFNPRTLKLDTPNKILRYGSINGQNLEARIELEKGKNVLGLHKIGNEYFIDQIKYNKV